LTSGKGWNNVVTASQSATARSEAPVCDVKINSLVFGGYSEESDWSGPMLAVYSGVVQAEQSCTDLVAEVSLTTQDGVKVITENATLTKTGTYTFNFTATVSAPNDYGYYHGALRWFP
jgi:hypothetical protein